MNTLHRLRALFIVVILLVAGVASLQLIDRDTGKLAVAAPVEPAPRQSSAAPRQPDSGGGDPSPAQEQADLDLVGASIGTYDR